MASKSYLPFCSVVRKSQPEAEKVSQFREEGASDCAGETWRRPKIYITINHNTPDVIV